MHQAMARAHRFLVGESIEYTFFKTVRPYPSWGKDADVMVLGDGRMYARALRTLLRAGYEPELPHLLHGLSLSDEAAYDRAVMLLSTPTFNRKHISPTGADLIDRESGVDIDLQLEFATSYIVWMDKALWRDKVNRVRLQSGDEVNTLAPELEMSVIIVHGLMEQSYRLGDYYAFLYHLSALPEEDMALFLHEVSRNRLVRVTRAFLALTAALHQAAHGLVPERVILLSAELGASPGEPARLARNSYRTPHSYSWGTLLTAMAEKLGEGRFAASLLHQGLHMFNPRVTWQVLLELRERGRAR
jgi:hypothetical protein